MGKLERFDFREDLARVGAIHKNNHSSLEINKPEKIKTILSNPENVVRALSEAIGLMSDSDELDLFTLGERQTETFRLCLAQGPSFREQLSDPAQVESLTQMLCQKTYEDIKQILIAAPNPIPPFSAPEMAVAQVEKTEGNIPVAA